MKMEMLNKIKKIFICLMLLCASLLTMNASEVNEKNEVLYYQTFSYQMADDYVEKNIGDFISSEMKISNFNINDVKIGKGIYVEDFIDDNLPLFYYPVFINNKLEYVFRIYDDGTDNYTGAFGKNLVDEVLKNASNDAEHAKLWAVSNGNELVISKNGDYEVIVKSKLNEPIESEIISNYNKKRSKDIFISANISDCNMDFVKYPSSRAYWVYNISYVETQGNNEWCYGFVTTMAIRTMAGNSVRTKNMAAAYGLSTDKGFTNEQVREYCSRYGVSYAGLYSGTITASTVYNEVSKWNLVIGSYKCSNLRHALLLHGIDGSKVRVWNPWRAYSEWVTNIKTYNTSGKSWSMYAYGYYR